MSKSAITPSFNGVLRQNLGWRQVVDLSALIRRESRREDHPLAPPASTSPVPLRRPSPARPREPGLAPPARRVQEDEASAQASHDGSPLLGRAGQGLDRVAAVPRDRSPCYRSAVAAPPLPRSLDPALRPTRWRPPARQRRAHRPGQENGRGESPVGRPQNPRRAPQARHRRGRAHRLPPDAGAPHTALADLAPNRADKPSSNRDSGVTVQGRRPPRIGQVLLRRVRDGARPQEEGEPGRPDDGRYQRPEGEPAAWVEHGLLAMSASETWRRRPIHGRAPDHRGPSPDI